MTRSVYPPEKIVYRAVLASDNSVLVPKGATVNEVVDVSHRRGHFKGGAQ